MTVEENAAPASLEAGIIDDRRYRAGTVAILLVAFGLRVLGTTAHSLWFDEAVEYFTASVPLSTLPEAVTTANYQPPLFSFFLHLWITLGIEPIWLRYLPLAFSMLTVAGIIAWSSRIFGTRGALLAGLVVAALPTEIYYAQDVGEYALLVFAVTWSLFLLDLARQTSTWSYWILWALVSLAGIYTHYGFAIVYLPAVTLVFIDNIRAGRRDVVKRQVQVLAATALAAVPLILFFLPSQISRVDQSLDNVAAYSNIVRELVTFVSSIGDTFFYYLIGWPTSNIPTWPGLILLLGLLILLITLRPRVPGIWYGWIAVAYLFYFILVRTGLYAGTFGLRYALVFTPLFVLIGAAAINALFRRRWIPAGLAVLLAVVAVELYALPTPVPFKILPGQSMWVPKEPMAELFDYWEEQRQAGEPTFVYYGAVPAFRYYLRLNNLDAERILPEARPFITCSAGQAHEVCLEYDLFYSSWVRQLSTGEKIRDMEEVLGGKPDRLWLIFSHVHRTEEDDMLHQLGEEYTIEQMLDPGMGEATIYLLVRS